MWVLLLMVITAQGKIAVYDQGIYKEMDECLGMKDALHETDFRGHNNIQLTCVRWERENSNISSSGR